MNVVRYEPGLLWTGLFWTDTICATTHSPTSLSG